tara:strand:- start:67 stop:480 length:414 start_codon:yes stop_codon:yes gene_type:complete
MLKQIILILLLFTTSSYSQEVVFVLLDNDEIIKEKYIEIQSLEFTSPPNFIKPCLIYNDEQTIDDDENACYPLNEYDVIKDKIVGKNGKWRCWLKLSYSEFVKNMYTEGYKIESHTTNGDRGSVIDRRQHWVTFVKQ